MNEAKDAGFKEMKHLNERCAVFPVHLETLTTKEKDEIIDSILLIEEKETRH